jgi:hypothetical protein
MISRLLLLLGALLVIGATEPPSQPVILSPAQAEKEGRALVAEMLSQTSNYTNTGVLKIHPAGGKWTPLPVQSEIIATESNWSSIYQAGSASNGTIARLTVTHTNRGPNEYRLTESGRQKTLTGNEAMIPFAGTDFWLADLGLEFFHWPEQRLVRREMRRSCSCDVLESINPQPAPGTYARVVSWIDDDSHGIVFAEAYDARNKLLKEFAPKDVSKVNGQWQVDEMEISNRQTGSRTRIEFHPNSH